MSPKSKEQLNEDEREAIREEGRAEGREEAMREAGETTPPISESSEAIRRLARMEAKPIARQEVADHSDHCTNKGALYSVAKIVDGLRVTIIRWGAALGLIVVLLPIGIAWYSNREADTRANESLRKTIDAAAEVARQLKAIQDASKGVRGSLEDPQPKKAEGLASAEHGATMPGRNW
jgi:hypothetical protein